MPLIIFGIIEKIVRKCKQDFDNCNKVLPLNRFYIVTWKDSQAFESLVQWDLISLIWLKIQFRSWATFWSDIGSNSPMTGMKREQTDLVTSIIALAKPIRNDKRK